MMSWGEVGINWNNYTHPVLCFHVFFNFMKAHFCIIVPFNAYLVYKFTTRVVFLSHAGGTTSRSLSTFWRRWSRGMWGESRCVWTDCRSSFLPPSLSTSRLPRMTLPTDSCNTNLCMWCSLLLSFGNKPLYCVWRPYPLTDVWGKGNGGGINIHVYIQEAQVCQWSEAGYKQYLAPQTVGDLRTIERITCIWFL